MAYTIAFFGTKPYDESSFNDKNKEFGFEIRYYKGHLNKNNVLLTQGVDAVCIFVNDVADAEVIRVMAANGVKLLALRCAGFNNVDLNAAAAAGITVVRVPAYSPYAVAEHAVGMILLLNRKLHRAYIRTRDHNFSLEGLTGFDLRNKTVGIIGTGKIGQAFCEIAKGFGMEILGFDPYENNEFDGKYVKLDELLNKSDIITLHCPLTKENRHIINNETIKKMKKGVFIINTSRGKLIDTQALIDGLKSGKVGAAGLDVYEEETSLFFEDFSEEIIHDDTLSTLISMPNVLVTSHQAFLTKEALNSIAETTMNNLRDYFDGKELKNQVKI